MSAGTSAKWLNCVKTINISWNANTVSYYITPVWKDCHWMFWWLKAVVWPFSYFISFDCMDSFSWLHLLILFYSRDYDEHTFTLKLWRSKDCGNSWAWRPAIIHLAKSSEGISMFAFQYKMPVVLYLNYWGKIHCPQILISLHRRRK